MELVVARLARLALRAEAAQGKPSTAMMNLYAEVRQLEDRLGLGGLAAMLLLRLQIAPGEVQERRPDTAERRRRVKAVDTQQAAVDPNEAARRV
jgi:hypothetical protein